MSKFTGTVKKNDLEGGFWELVNAQGTHYQLQGGGPDLRVDGQQVEIEGRVESSAMGIGMVGEILTVQSWRASC